MRPDECIVGHVYYFHARNFNIGVYAGAGRFVGIRSKYGSRFLDVEYHLSEPVHGTVSEVRPVAKGLVYPGPIPSPVPVTEDQALFDFLDGICL